MSATVRLPEQLAPALRERVLDLLEHVQVSHPPVPAPPRTDRRRENRCVVCHRSGVLGGHHAADGRVVWVHRSCHRRLHRRLDARRGGAGVGPGSGRAA